MGIPFTVLDRVFWSANKDLSSVLAAKDAASIELDYTAESPDISFVPMLMRRRFSQLTKMLFYVGHSLMSTHGALPVIFISKYGEINRQCAISKKLINERCVSPALFGFSVFNTAPALLSIAEKNTNSAVAINCSERFLETGLTVSLSFLGSKNEQRVLLILADEKIPDVYAEISRGEDYSYALGLVLSLEQKDFVIETAVHKSEKGQMRRLLDFLRFLHTSDTQAVALDALRVVRNAKN